MKNDNVRNLNTEANQLANINKINEYLKRNYSVLQQISDKLRSLNDIREQNREKKIILQNAEEERKALEEARLKQEREKAEAIKQATAGPIIEEPEVKEEVVEEVISEKVEDKVEIEEPVVVTEEKVVEPVKVEKPQEVAEPVKVQQKGNTSVQAKEEETSQMKAAKAAAQQILNKSKKPVVEKPVIRVYRPPVEERRPKRNEKPAGNNQQNRDKNNAQQNGGMNTFQRQNTIEHLNNSPVLQKDTQKKKVFDNAPEEKTQLAKKTKLKKGIEGGSSALVFDDDGNLKKIRTRKTDNKNKAPVITEAIKIEHAIITKDNVTIKELSEKIGKTGSEIIKRLFQLGIMKTINDTIDFDTAELVASDLGVTLELQREETSEEKLLSYFDQETEDESQLVQRPPIITIMGHVDHGKTSILDYIKKSKVAAGEAGGITQHISAYTINVKGSQISFLDTPGHAAFTAMRARGANVTDIIVIVIAADDGIMPQTVEVINHAKAAKDCKIVVAINKIDKNTADPDRVMTQLTEYGLVPEAWGGTIPVVKVSAKTGEGIDELLETLVLEAEVMELKANPNRKAKGTVVEARLDKGKGPLATILVQTGTLKVGDHIVVGTTTGKIRAMQDDKGRNVKSAGPSTAVMIFGLDEVPGAGDQLMAFDDDKLLKSVVADRIAEERERKINSGSVSLEDLYRNIEEGKMKNLNIIIKADVQGSVEAIRDSLQKLSTDEVKVTVPHAMVGAINESDIILAESTSSIIVGFNVRPDNNAKKLAEEKKIEIRLHRIIYDAIDEVTAAIKGLSAPKYREEYLGKAEVRQTYKISSVGTIAGCMVLDGKIVRNAKVRLIRDNIVIADTSINSLKRMKDNVTEVLHGFECGIGLDGWNDIKEGDIIESFNIVEDK